ncbi:hypothetical protein EDD16DRAFT_1690561 [Pisolithus croceorrhizus]|nr:hypothetical protein EV401DRAFT_900420 [Pisolithus croceorrhizus]KAI6127609.1 hypothetical protein EDD16DRAFT_1690561 [Pisolithus croceorrhizus]KAI6162755.1 hypothetical protein EDD17DRAFT_1477650 [Pisolithus thermaeus]
MLSSVAWLRRFASLLLALSPLVACQDDSLFTSSVTYCSEPDALLIQQFEIIYFQQNSSVWFNISAASVQPDVNVSANIFLNVYGMHPVNYTIDLCSLFNGALCPLPTYNFTGSDTIPLPSSLNLSQMIPEIAFKIPDLEAYAQLSLTEVTTGALKACVQATLSNGWSAHQVGVEWATSGLALLALLSAIWFSTTPDNLLPFRFVDLFYLYQWAASTALLDLNYSSVYIAFATNFAWALGLLSASANSPIQLAINNMRHLTGGTMADASGGSAVAFVNRKLSPYNAAVAMFFSGTSQLLNINQEVVLMGSNSTLANYASSASIHDVKQLDSAGTVQLVTSSSSNVLQAGIPIYVNYVGIATANAFMTIFLIALMVLAIFLLIVAIGYGIAVLLTRRNRGKATSLPDLQERFTGWARAWLLRLCLIVFTPATIFTLYQWTLEDSWLSVLLSVLFLLVVAGYLSYHLLLIARLAVRGTPSALYTEPKYLISGAPLFALYRPERYYAALPLLVATLLKAVLTAFAHADGEVQIIFFLVIEVGVLATLLILRPHKTRGADILATYLAITRVICTGLLVCFVEEIGLGAIPRVVVGIVAAVFISVAVIVMFINILLSAAVPYLWRHRSTSSAEPSTLEKGAPEDEETERPVNPTPEQMIPLDSSVNQPYPDNASQTSMEDRSVYTQESGSTTVGSLLPRHLSLRPSELSHSRNSSISHSHNSFSRLSSFISTNASSPIQCSTPSPSYSHMQLQGRQPTVDEHPPTSY